MANAFYELAIKNAKKQTVMIDSFTEEAPILASLPMEPTSDGLTNVYEKILTIDPAEAVDFDESLSELDMKTILEQSQLSKFGGLMSVGEDKAQALGGHVSYFGKKLPHILMQTGSVTEASILYHNIRAYAFANDKLVDAGGTGSVNYSILIVKWVAGQTTGLYDSAGLGNGKVFDILPLNNGGAHKLTGGEIGYAQRLATYFGVQLANSRYVGGIANIDPAVANDAAMVTEEMMDDLITDTYGNPANTRIYMHPKMLNKLNRYKSSKLQMFTDSKDVNRTFAAWNGIPIETSYNFKPGTEARVIIS